MTGGNWGTCEWKLSEEGILTIGAGTGESIAPDGKAPWFDVREKIREIRFGDAVRFLPGVSLGYMFKDCENLVKVDLSGIDTSGVGMMHSMFEGCRSLEEIDLSPLDTSSVTSFTGLFSSCENLRTIGMEGLNTSSMISMIGTFMNCSSLERIDLSQLDTSNVIDMSWLFCGCRSLKEADLSCLNTEKVMDMSCMFLNCTQLEKVRFGTIDTSSVMDMSRMFMYCGKLKTLDFSGIDNGRTDMADDMLFGCEGLRALVPGSRFTMSGSGKAMISLPENGDSGNGEMVSDWRTSLENVYYIPGTEFEVHYDGNGSMPFTSGSTDFTAFAGDSLTAEDLMFVAPPDRVFREWNTHKDGSGRRIMPGDSFPVHSDMTIYAVWAGRPVFTKVYDIPPAVYGSKPKLTAPEVDDCMGELTRLETQILVSGSGDWQKYSDDMVLSAADSGIRIRYEAENFVGSTVSEEKPLTILKDTYDMSGVSWKLPDNLVYDGTEKTVSLTGLPEGVTARLAGNRGILAGNYTASAVLDWDKDNFEAPKPVPDLKWSVSRGTYELSGLQWSYEGSFVYDGKEKSVRLSGLPDGTTPYYAGADAVDAGTYIATAGLDYDFENFDQPGMIRPCKWEILKTSHDMSGVHWAGPEAFIYDGTLKEVRLTGVPEGLRVEYTGNTGTGAGKYTARAAFIAEDPVNYEQPEPVSFEWQILKADHDLSGAAWTDTEPVYDGTEKTVVLTGVPEGVSVSYEGNSATEAGSYAARAEFSVEDLNNYNPLDPVSISWEIRRADIDISRMHWNYSSPYVYNGAVKTVELKNIPEELTVTYEEASAVDAGSYTARAFCEFDRANYNEPVILPCVWEIRKADLKLSDITWEYDPAATYDGTEKSVRISGLPENAAVRYENASAAAAGPHTTRAFITPLDENNYKVPDPIEFTWDIRKAVFDISGAVWDAARKRVFDGEDKTVHLENLPAGVSASYQGNEGVDAGTYRAKAYFTVEDTDNYLAPDPMEVCWDIDPAPLDLSGVRWDYKKPFVYDGSEKRIMLTGLPEGVTARYEGNVASGAGEYAAKAVLIPPKDSSFRETEILGQVWRIDRRDPDISSIRWDYSQPFVYDGTSKSVALTGVPAGYRIEYTGDCGTDAGEYTAKAEIYPGDMRNYNRPPGKELEWSILQADIDMSGAYWSGSDTFVYDGTTHSVILNGLPSNVEAVYENNAAENAGHYVARASFRPLDERNYRVPSPMVSEWAVAKADIDVSGVRWDNDEEIIYDRNEHELKLTGLPDNLNARYSGNTATDAGHYIASAVLEPVDPDNFNTPVIEPCRWEILKAELDVSNVMWASSGELVYDGTVKVVGLTGLPEEVNVQYENNAAVEAGTYHASAVLSIESSNYDAPEIEGCTWTIRKAVPDITGVGWNYVFDFIYDGYEKSVELMDLPEGMSAEYKGNTAVDAGTYTAEAVISVADPVNYEAPQVQPLQWTIAKREYDMTGVSWECPEGPVYDGKTKHFVLTGLPEGLIPVYEGNEAVDAGEYTASVKFRYDERNYIQPEDMQSAWTIEKAELDTSGAKWNYQGPFSAGGRMKTVELETEGPRQSALGRLFGGSREVKYLGLPEGTEVRYENNTAKAPGVYEAKAYLTVPEQPNHRCTLPVTLTWEIRED